METLTGLLRSEGDAWHEYARLPVPPDYPVARSLARPGEVMYPGLEVVDWLRYLETIQDLRRRKSVRKARRVLFLTTQRVIVLDETKRDRISLPLVDIEDVSLMQPPGAPTEMSGETLIQILFRAAGPPEQRRLVGWTTRTEDAEVFVGMLNELMESARESSGSTAGDIEATGSNPRNDEPRFALLRSRLGSEEHEFAQTTGWERIPTGGEAEVLMLVTDQRVLWMYAKGPSDVILDVWFRDVVAFLGSEGEGGLIFEAAETRYDDISAGETTLALFRLKDLASAVEIIRFVERRIPSAARDLIPDVSGTGRHESYSSFEGGLD